MHAWGDVAPIYSVRFGVVNTSAGGTVVVYTVPAGYVAVLRDVDAYFPSGLGPQLFLQDGSVPISFALLAPTAVPGSVQWHGRQVFTAGEEIAVNLTATPIRALLSGYLLTV